MRTLCLFLVAAFISTSVALAQGSTRVYFKTQLSGDVIKGHLEEVCGIFVSELGGDKLLKILDENGLERGVIPAMIDVIEIKAASDSNPDVFVTAGEKVISGKLYGCAECVSVYLVDRSEKIDLCGIKTGSIKLERAE